MTSGLPRHHTFLGLGLPSLVHLVRASQETSIDIVGGVEETPESDRGCRAKYSDLGSEGTQEAPAALAQSSTTYF